MQAFRWIKIGFFTISTLALLLAAYCSMRSWSLEHRGERTTGTVIALEKHVWYSTRQTTVEYAPRVRFQLPDGRPVEFSSAAGNNPPDWHIGDAIPVLYSPSHPQRAEVRSFWQLWEQPMIWGIVAVILFGISAFFRMVSHAAEREESGATVSLS